jgi:hypothetical protein
MLNLHLTEKLIENGDVCFGKIKEKSKDIYYEFVGYILISAYMDYII